MDDLELCPGCKRTYPSDLITQMMTSSGYHTTCPLCALALRNAMHGMGEEPFGGEIARQMFNDARAHLIKTKQKVSDWESKIVE